MKVGFSLPHMGPAASRDAVVKAAQRAEELGYDSVWALERLLYPLKPQTPFPATPDGSLPDIYKQVLDPLATLAFVAAQTTRIGLGTSVLVMPYYNPVMLARQLTALDVLSGGRLRLGLGLGWSKDEYDAVGAAFKERGAKADEFLQVLKTIWTTDPAEFHGKFYHLPKSIIQPKPVQKPHPPIYLATFVPNGLKRIAKLADGWIPDKLPPDRMAQMFQSVKEMAKAEGRDPSVVQLVVKANLQVTEKPLGKDSWFFSGSLDQIKEDIQGCRKVGAHELFFDPILSPDVQTLDRFLSRMEQMRGLV